ncbi:MAG: PmoA family protein [Bacteroidales bacterium]|nr:PmoA family protein [Bacteroidales bacterium]
MMKRITQILLLFVILVSVSGFAQEPVARIEIQGIGDPVTQGISVPVRVQLKSGVVQQGVVYQLQEVIDDERVEVSSQIRYGEFDELSWVIESNGDSVRVFELFVEVMHDLQSQQQSQMTSSINDTTIILSKNHHPILHYRHALLPPPSGQADKWARSGFIHPLYSPAGEVLTWVQPPDHFHHMGLWNPWTRVTWKGNHTDFWNLGDEQGTVRFKNITGIESGEVFSEFRVVQDHVALNKTQDLRPKTQERSEVVVMTEEWIVRVWNIADGYFLDFTSVLTNVTDDTVSLDAYRYGGGLGYRATEKWNNTNSQVLTSEGKTWKNGDATRAKWCRVSGDLNGIETGLLFLSDPGNYDFPQLMRIWPENSTGGIGHQFFEFTPIREKTWILESGKSYSQRYRIWVNEGDLPADIADVAWKSYANQPAIKISYLNPQ